MPLWLLFVLRFHLWPS
uniref:Uncharacterized protein n=1 Tax=Rhizophora mucronata TaxID=61149 RepID=A0A2P2Q104_RHIMU